MLDDLIGKPFAHGGRGPDSYDCYGLALEVQRRSGVLAPDFNYPETPEEIHRVIASATEQFIRVDSPAPFCFVTFMIRPPYTSHVGVVLPDTIRFIHSWERSSVCIERLDSLAWKRRITGFYQWHN